MAARKAEDRSTRPPNVVLIHTRELGRYVQPYAGGIKAPGIQRLAEKGVTFTQAFAGALGGVPAGACLFTGRRALASGVLATSPHARLSKPKEHLAHLLADVGYRTIRVGFEHFNDQVADLGYSDSLELPDNWNAADVADGAVGYLKAVDSSTPFFLSVGFRETARDFPGLCWHNLSGPTSYKPFKAMVACIDKAIGEIVETAQGSGDHQNTWIILTSDHGNQEPVIYPDYSPVGMGMTLIIAGPGLANPGRNEAGLVGQTDVAPTILDLCGAGIPGAMEGRSLKPMLFGKKAKQRARYRFSEVNMLAGGEFPLRMAWADDRRHLCWAPAGLPSDHAAIPAPGGHPGDIACPGAWGQKAQADARLWRALVKWLRDTEDPWLAKSSGKHKKDLTTEFVLPDGSPNRWVVAEDRRCLLDVVPEKAWCPKGWVGDLRFNRPPRDLADIIVWIDALLDANAGVGDAGGGRFEFMVDDSDRSLHPEAAGAMNALHNTWLLLEALVAGGLIEEDSPPRPSWAMDAGLAPEEAIKSATHHLQILRRWCLNPLGEEEDLGGTLKADSARRKNKQPVADASAEPTANSDHDGKRLHAAIMPREGWPKIDKPTKAVPLNTLAEWCGMQTANNESFKGMIREGIVKARPTGERKWIAEIEGVLAYGKVKESKITP